MTRQREAEIIRDVADRLGTKAHWLDALINFETAGTYSPLIKNPNSSARGLIQVIDSTAQSDFGYSDSSSLVMEYPDFESQMYNVVLPYLQKYKPFPTKQSLYMAVFYPKYRDVPRSTVFPEHVRKVNPGITTVQDYINFVDRRIKTSELRIPKSIPVLMAAILTGTAVYLYTKSRKG